MLNSNKTNETLSDKSQVRVQEETFANTRHLWKLQEQMLSRNVFLM